MFIDTVAVESVAKILDYYAAMSHRDFFAKMHVFYYDCDDPKRTAIPATVAKWLNENIGRRDAENPRRPAAPQKPEEIENDS